MINRIYRFLPLMLIIVLLLASCAPVADPTATPEPPELGDGTSLEEAQQELDRNRQRWQEQGAADYVYTLTIGCFCVPDLRRPVRIEVRDGEPVSLQYVEGGGAPSDPGWFEPYDTIEDVFAFIQEAIDRDAAKIEARYDAEMGIPLYVAVDYDFQIADEEISLEISGFGITR